MSERNDENNPGGASAVSGPSLPPDAPLEQLIHDPSPEILRAVAGDSRLTEDLAMSLLERRDLPRQALELLSRNKSLARRRKVQLGIVMHPHAPRHVSIPIIRHLYSFELMQVALTPSVAPDVKRASEETLVGKLGTISSGERLELAKRGSGRVAAALLLDQEQRIMEASLENPQMTEVWIVKALKTGSGTGLLAPALCRHEKWSQRTDVKAALIANPHTPFARVVEFAGELSPRILKEIVNSAPLAAPTKTYLSKMLESQSR
jgi:hypothetical protein